MIELTPAKEQKTRCSRCFIKTDKAAMIRNPASGKYRLYSRKKNPKTGRRRNLGSLGRV